MSNACVFNSCLIYLMEEESSYNSSWYFQRVGLFPSLTVSWFLRSSCSVRWSWFAESQPLIDSSLCFEWSGVWEGDTQLPEVSQMTLCQVCAYLRDYHSLYSDIKNCFALVSSSSLASASSSALASSYTWICRYQAPFGTNCESQESQAQICFLELQQCQKSNWRERRSRRTWELRTQLLDLSSYSWQ